MTHEPNDVTAKLVSLGVDETVAAKILDELGVTTEADLSALTEADLVGIGMKPVPARNLLAAITPPVDGSAESVAGVLLVDQLLPVVPEDESWLKSLQTGGVLKVDQTKVIAAIRAGLAQRVGLFELPKVLASAMEEFADTNDEQVGPEYFAIRKGLTRRNYSELFATIDGLDGTFITERRRHMLFDRLEQHLWPAVGGFNESLRAWMDGWTQGASGQMLMLSMMAAATGRGGSLPPGVGAVPDTGVLRDSAAAVNDAINRAFAGTGVPVASALAIEARDIRATLENPQLPAMIGAANREQMLKKLGVNVPATYPRLETNVTRFVLGIIRVEDQPGGNEEAQYFGALHMLGTQIDWSTLGLSLGGIGGIGERRL